MLGAQGRDSHGSHSQEGTLAGDGLWSNPWMRCLLQYMAVDIDKWQLDPGSNRYPRPAVTTSLVRSRPKRQGISDQKLKVSSQTREYGLSDDEKIYHDYIE